MAYLARVKQGFGSMFSFFTDSWSELKKVKWPTRKELITYTIVVIVTVTFVTLYFWGIDYLLTILLRFFNE
ncbi:preprotein translocase subunit SecE [Paenibacillus koleovorans]|uniref:preprotein translocase subunit SecE n=1 Tax=Paenibacillus koleovorans TaxID=121608 RepID=UPI000FDA2B2C|nr:preprotein translocase subunit SecE [Paenibacillus koleovorans]